MEGLAEAALPAAETGQRHGEGKQQDGQPQRGRLSDQGVEDAQDESDEAEDGLDCHDGMISRQ
jgi:hypothetical protein